MEIVQQEYLESLLEKANQVLENQKKIEGKIDRLLALRNLASQVGTLRQRNGN